MSTALKHNTASCEVDHGVGDLTIPCTTPGRRKSLENALVAKRYEQEEISRTGLARAQRMVRGSGHVASNYGSELFVAPGARQLLVIDHGRGTADGRLNFKKNGGGKPDIMNIKGVPKCTLSD
jgi:hypothetical protein